MRQEEVQVTDSYSLMRHRGGFCIGTAGRQELDSGRAAAQCGNASALAGVPVSGRAGIRNGHDHLLRRLSHRHVCCGVPSRTLRPPAWGPSRAGVSSG